jgi:multisubunit Na+/H+ antiporter MnhB subunit
MPVKTWLLASSVLFTIVVILLLLNYSRLGDLFHTHVRDRPKRRLLLAAIGFFVTFAVARAMAWGAYRNVAPFRYVYVGGTQSDWPK